MPTRNISLTPELDREVSERIESGRYESASDVMRAALRALSHQEREEELRLEALRKKLEASDKSGIFEGDPFDAVYIEFGLPKPKLPRKRA